MGLFDFLLGGQNPYLHWWREPRMFRAKLLYSTFQSLTRLVVAVVATIFVMLCVAVASNNAIDPGIALLMGAGFGAFGWAIFLMRHDMTPGKVLAHEDRLERISTGQTLMYFTHTTETWRYSGIHECRIIPGETIGKPFSLMLVRSGAQTDLIGIPRRIDVKALARHLELGGVPVVFSSTVPKSHISHLTATWYTVAAAVLGIFVLVTVGLVATGRQNANRGDVAAANHFDLPQGVDHRMPAAQPRGADWTQPAEEAARPRITTKPHRPSNLPRAPRAPAWEEDEDENADWNDPEDDPAETPLKTPPAPQWRTWSDTSGKFEIDAKMIDFKNDTVTLQRRDGQSVDVPLQRLSQADRDYIGEAASTEKTKRLAQGTKADTPLAGGNEGWPFRSEGDEQVLGVAYTLGGWAGEKTVDDFMPVFDRSPNAGHHRKVVMAREGYAVGGLHAEAERFVNAVQVVFMRIGPDGRLDPTDQYRSEWIGYRGGKPVKTIGCTGDAVVGIQGRRGAILNAVGLVLQGN